MFSTRFNKPVYITDHAKVRMASRAIDEKLLHDLIETGQIRNKDVERLWIAKDYSDRADNLICAAISLEKMLVIKTVMNHFSWDSES